MAGSSIDELLDFADMDDEQAGTAPEQSAEVEDVVVEATSAATVHEGHDKTDGLVTGAIIHWKKQVIDPAKVVVHPANPRRQSLLRPDRPEVQALADQIVADGQIKHPVYARRLDNGDYQILDGSKRCAAGRLILSENRLPGFEFPAWVAFNPLQSMKRRPGAKIYPAISEEDAIAIARSGNHNRDDESAWEQATYLYAINDERHLNGLKEYEQTELATILAKSQSYVSSIMHLAQIPESLVKLLQTPSILGRRQGAKLLDLLSEHKVEMSELVAELEKSFKVGEISNFNAVLKVVPALSNKNKGGRPATAFKPITIANNAVLSKIRGKDKTFKLSLTDLSDDQAKKLAEGLKRLIDDL